MCKNPESWGKYKKYKNEAKKEMSQARTQVFYGLQKYLETKEREKSIYRIAKERERNTRGLDKVWCVKMKNAKSLCMRRI